jgi:hypothetical protein
MNRIKYYFHSNVPLLVRILNTKGGYIATIGLVSTVYLLRGSLSCR